MLRVHVYAILLSAIIIALFGTGCRQTAGYKTASVPASVTQKTVKPHPLPDQRVPLSKTDTLPAGDVIKRWHWDIPWEIRSADGTVIRWMRSPDWSNTTPMTGGPHITVIQDPRRGTIYEAFFVQRTEKVFDLPVTLYFFATRESPTPLFALPFTDPATIQCRPGQVSRGNIMHPAIPLALIESAAWVGVGWQSAAYEDC
jgi:hypothetical protein